MKHKHMLSVGVKTLIPDTLAMAASAHFSRDHENFITLLKNSGNAKCSTKYSISMTLAAASYHDKTENSILHISI